MADQITSKIYNYTLGCLGLNILISFWYESNDGWIYKIDIINVLQSGCSKSV